MGSWAETPSTKHSYMNYLVTNITHIMENRPVHGLMTTMSLTATGQRIL